MKSTCASLTLSLSQWGIFKVLRYSIYLFIKLALKWSNIAMEAHFRNTKILSTVMVDFLIQRFQCWMITQLVLFGSKLGHTQNHLGTPWEREPGCVGCYDADFQRWGGPAQGDLKIWVNLGGAQGSEVAWFLRFHFVLFWRHNFCPKMTSNIFRWKNSSVDKKLKSWWTKCWVVQFFCQESKDYQITLET